MLVVEYKWNYKGHGWSFKVIYNFGHYCIIMVRTKETKYFLERFVLERFSKHIFLKTKTKPCVT